MKKILFFLISLFLISMASCDLSKTKQADTKMGEEIMPLELQIGTYTAGKDFPIGRYKLESKSQNSSDSGTINVYQNVKFDSDGEIDPDIRLDDSFWFSTHLNPQEVTVCIYTFEEGFILQNKEVPQIILTPLSDEKVTLLISGIWEVGVDVRSRDLFV